MEVLLLSEKIQNKQGIQKLEWHSKDTVSPEQLNKNEAQGEVGSNSTEICKTKNTPSD